MHPLSLALVIGWIIFWLYWIVSAFGSKKEAPANIKQFFVIRITLFPLVVVLVLIFDRLPDSLRNHYQSVTSNHLVMAVGLFLFLGGLVLAIWARRHLGKNWGMPMTKKQAPELVTSGPYHYIRHPIYTGFLLMTLGSFLGICMFWLIIFVVAGIFFVYSAYAEERLMQQQFPRVYSSYKAKTKMLIPFLF
jgi:protein-S-isoprenylcysteine O-methyltransferase Ste14